MTAECFNEGRIQSYIDGELPPAEMEAVRLHLDSCRECARLYRRLLDNEELVRSSMTGLLYADRELFDAESAWSRIKPDSSDYLKKRKRGAFKMKYKRIISAAAAVLVMVGLLSYGPVRSLAGEFLSVFRVEKVKIISITPQDMMNMEKAIRDGAGVIDIDNFGRLEVTGRQEIVPVALEQAQNEVDFNLKIPDVNGYDKPVLKKMSGSKITLAMDVNNINSMLQSLGSKNKLPDELDGKEFTLDMPAGIIAEYAGEAGRFTVIQSRSPSIQTDAGANVKEIRDALLTLPVLPENLKKQLEAVEDWQHTALIPVETGRSSEVAVNGVQGVFYSPEGQGEASLIWQKNGVIFIISGSGLDLPGVLAIAGKLN